MSLQSAEAAVTSTSVSDLIPAIATSSSTVVVVVVVIIGGLPHQESQNRGLPLEKTGDCPQPGRALSQVP